MNQTWKLAVLFIILPLLRYARVRTKDPTLQALLDDAITALRAAIGTVETAITWTGRAALRKVVLPLLNKLMATLPPGTLRDRILDAIASLIALDQMISKARSNVDLPGSNPV